jgi:hypothetical protein
MRPRVAIGCMPRNDGEIASLQECNALAVSLIGLATKADMHS